MPFPSAPQPYTRTRSKVNELGSTSSGANIDSNTLPIGSIDRNLQLELVQMQHALNTAFTPGHDALKERCERAEARVKIVQVDLRAANARKESARAESLVLNAQLENEQNANAKMQTALNEKEKQVDLLKRRNKALASTEKSLKQKNKGLDAETKDSNRKICDLRRVLAEQQKQTKELEARLEQSVAKEKKTEATMEKLNRLNAANRSARNALGKTLKDERAAARKAQINLQRRLDQETQRVKALVEERDTFKSHLQKRLDVAKQCTKTLEEERESLKNELQQRLDENLQRVKNLEEERDSLKKEMQRRLDHELDRIKALQRERDSWKHKAEGNAQGLRGELDRSTRHDEIQHAYILPSATALMDGNNDALLSPAPLARIAPRTSPGSSDSGTAFLPLPFPNEEDSVDVPLTPTAVGATNGATEEGADDAVATTQGTESPRYFPEPSVDYMTPAKSRIVNRAIVNASKPGQKKKRKRTRQKSAAESLGHGPASGPTKRQKAEKKSVPGKSSVDTKTGLNRKVEKADASGPTVERKASGRVLRNRRPVSYNYDEDGRDIVKTSPDYEIDQSEVQKPMQSRGKKGTRQPAGLSN